MALAVGQMVLVTLTGQNLENYGRHDPESTEGEQRPALVVWKDDGYTDASGNVVPDRYRLRVFAVEGEWYVDQVPAEALGEVPPFADAAPPTETVPQPGPEPTPNDSPRSSTWADTEVPSSSGSSSAPSTTDQPGDNSSSVPTPVQGVPSGQNDPQTGQADTSSESNNPQTGNPTVTPSPVPRTTDSDTSTASVPSDGGTSSAAGGDATSSSDVSATPVEGAGQPPWTTPQASTEQQVPGAGGS